MKNFFTRYSYDSVRMLLDQIVIAIFGFSLAVTSVHAESDALLCATSVGAIVFYLALIYGVGWKMGQRDCKSVRYGQMTYRPFTGVWVALLANSINLLVAVAIMVGTLTGAEAVSSVANFMALMGQAMYQGILSVVKIGGQLARDVWWVYFLLPIPAIIVAGFAYTMGAKDRVLTKMAIPDLPASDRPTKQEKKEQKRAEKNNRGE